MAGNIIKFPVAPEGERREFRPGVPMPEETADIVAHILDRYGRADPVEVAGAMLTVLAGIASVNSDALAEARECAAAFAADLDAIIVDMMGDK